MVFSIRKILYVNHKNGDVIDKPLINCSSWAKAQEISRLMPDTVVQDENTGKYVKWVTRSDN